MRKQYDFSAGKKGAVIASPGKTRITIMLDDDIIEHFRAKAEAEGVGYLAPRDTNTTPEGRTRNRRVEVMLISGG